MDNIDKNINIGDITFDDMLDGAIEDVTTVEEPQEEKVETDENVKETISESEETSLDEDAEAKKEEESSDTSDEIS